jgi:hypothetical protein
MGRPARNRTPEQTDGIANANINGDALSTAHAALDVHARQIALVEERYSTGLTYNLDLFVSRARELVAETGARMVELGLILVHIREREPQGGFVAALEKIGVAPRFAQKCMQSAVKFGADSRVKLLAAQLGSAKVLELLAEDDDDIAELAEGGTLAGYTVDELTSMTARELREALRAERTKHADEKDTDEEIIRKKDDRINKLMRERRAAGKTDATQKAEEMLKELDALAVEAASTLRLMRETQLAIEHTFADAGEECPLHITERVDQTREYAAGWLREVSSEV